MEINKLRVTLFDAQSNPAQNVDVLVGEGRPFPQVLIVDDYYYVLKPRPDGSSRYELAIGRQTIRTKPVPIYMARMFVKPVEFEAKRIRLFSGCHGAVTFIHEHSEKLAWNTRSTLTIRGLTGVRINGVWCPELPRAPGESEEQAFVHDQAMSALKAMKEILRGPTNFRQADMKFSALGIDEYGRLVCDVKLFEPLAFAETVEQVTPIAPKALATGLFSPTVLCTE